ncbi:MAG: BMC domain-containing protein [Cellulosilyticaceae bacterium]
MGRSIGAIEFRSISKGIEVANEMVKKVSVEIIYLKTVCPGKFVVMVTGDEGEITETVTYGKKLGEGYIIDSFVIHAVNDAIISGFRNKYISKDAHEAIAIFETNKVCAGIKALDKTLKASDVQLVKVQLAFAIGGKFVFIVTGTLSSVMYGTEAAKKILRPNDITNVSIIPSPSIELLEHLL